LNSNEKSIFFYGLRIRASVAEKYVQFRMQFVVSVPESKVNELSEPESS